MRISAESGDPGYSPMYLHARVWFNGVERKDVVTADEEKGMVVVYVRHDNGELRLDHGARAMMTEILFGKVVIEVSAREAFE